jgi:hypothetical protein
MLDGNGGTGLLDLHEPEDILVAAVDTLRTLALLLLERHPFFPLNAVNPDDEVVAVETLAIEGAYDRRLDCGGTCA